MANENALAIVKARGSNATVRPLGALATILGRVQDRLYQAPSNEIPGLSPTGWPSPLQPVRPFGPPDAQPLGLNMMMGQNLIFTPRPDSRYSAEDLQVLARYPLARICITNVIDAITSLKWKVQLRAQPGEDRKTREAQQLKDDTILKLTDFLSAPDGEHEFQDWLRPLLNDMLTIDAGCFLLRKNEQGTVFEWRVMQGAYISRLVDGNGYTPASPAPAYQQLWEGVPRVNLTSDQLIYRPRNIVYQVGDVSSGLYGFSPTEQLAEELEIGIQRLRYVKAFYKDGAIPNVLWVVPADTSPDKVREAQNYLNSDMSGNLESRRMFRFSQGFRGAESPKEDQIKQFEEPKLSDDYDDLHTRRVCMGYGTSPQRLLKMQNRATAESNQEAAEEEGIRPFVRWTEGTINRAMRRQMGYFKYEFTFDVSSDPDPVKQSEVDANDIGSGVTTINEARVARGKDPRPEPECDQVGKWIVTGWVPIGFRPPEPDESDAGNNPDSDPDPDPKSPKPGTGKQRTEKSNAAAHLDPNRDTVRSRAAASALFSAVYHFFHQIRSNMVIVTGHASKMRKADDDKKPDEAQIEKIVDTIMESIPWNKLPEAVEPSILDAAQEGADAGVDQSARAFQSGPMTISLSPTPVRVIARSMISDVNQVAMDYARDRGAELVGMRWVKGVLVQNPNASMAITDSTRNMLRQILTDAFTSDAPMSELADEIRAAGVFSEERAKLIAETEVKFAQSRGNLEAWKRIGVVKSIKWVLSSLHEDQDECDENAEEGPIALGETFSSGDPAPPAHPRCICGAAIAELNDPKKKAA